MTNEQNLVNGKQPIVNGSFNHNLTFDEMLQFDFNTKKDLCHKINVSGGFAHSFKNVDPAVFTPIIKKYTFEMFTEENVNDILTTLRTEFNQHHKQMLSLTRDYYFGLGKEIAAAQKKLGFGGFLEMDYRKLIGYLAEIGSWNDFHWPTVTNAIAELEKLAPKAMYGPNNPNNGNNIHKWESTGEYVVMKFGYLSPEQLQEVEKFYKDHWQAKQATIKADSCRIESQCIDERINKYEATLIYWWD